MSRFESRSRFVSFMKVWMEFYFEVCKRIGGFGFKVQCHTVEIAQPDNWNLCYYIKHLAYIFKVVD